MSDYSLNESASRAKLAVRGVGYSWGVAEDASRALYWLSSHGIDGFSALCAVLDNIDSKSLGAPSKLIDTWSCEQSALCPLLTGLCINDRAAQLIDLQSIALGKIAYPVLTLPFLSDVTLAYCCTLQFACSEFEAVVAQNSVAIHGDFSVASTDAALVSCSSSEIELTGKSYNHYSRSKKRVNIDEAIWLRLGEYAQRTYAPATEQSRLLGAGAGVVDSD